MAKDPAMLFYTKDFLTGVAFLSMKERGQYITLLCLQQQLGHMSKKQMETAVGKISPGLWEKFVEDEQGLWYNVRADVEIGKRLAHCEKQRETIMKRWNKTPADDTTVDTTVDTTEDTMVDTTDIPRYNHGITTVIPLANANANIQDKARDKGTIGRREKEFSIFWEAYPKKVGKQAARKSFDRIPASEIPKLVPAVEAQKQSQQWKREGGRFIPNPATWLNQGRWDDEVQTGHETGRGPSLQYEPVDLNRLQDVLDSMGGEI